MSFSTLSQKLKKMNNPLVSYLFNTGQRLKFSYLSLEDILIDAKEWSKILPKDTGVIVGIPRTGLIIAAVIATELGKPLATPDLIIDNKFWYKRETDEWPQDLSQILIIDDSIDTGTALNRTLEFLKEKKPNALIRTGALYLNKHAIKPDFYFKRLHTINTLQPSLLHHHPGSIFCDLDGVLCEDYPGGMNELEYTSWLSYVRPYKIPTFEIDCIVTGRLEKYRNITELWLLQNNIKYKKLLMRKENEGHYQQKIKIALRDKPTWFWESDPHLSKWLHIKTGVKVLCLQNGRVYG
jgi:hypoxanthine phosphoribosyltransferase